jgi:hypothetical protein
MTRQHCTEEDVYEASGITEDVVRSLSGKQKAEVTKLMKKYIDRADKKVRRRLGVPITIRKEDHQFDQNETLKLGQYEDQFEFFGIDSPENCVEKIHALYLIGNRNTVDETEYRVKLPYPKNCDDLSEDITDMTGTNVTLTKETDVDIVKCGDACVKAVFSAAGNFYFPSAGNLQKNIYPWEYISFWFRTSDKTATFTVTLEDKDGNTVSKTFTLNFNDTWEIVNLEREEDFGDIDWSTINLQKITIASDKACTIYFDNFNFNDGYFWTAPEGLICWADRDADPWGNIRVTYSYDPYKENVPEDVREASSKLAGVMLLDYCIGLRISKIGFKKLAENLEEIPDKLTLEVMRNRLKREAADALRDIGYHTYEGIGTS